MLSIVPDSRKRPYGRSASAIRHSRLGALPRQPEYSQTLGTAPMNSAASRLALARWQLWRVSACVGIVFLLSSCGTFFPPRGANLQLDQRTIQAPRTCTFTASSNCETARIAPDQVWCNYPGLFGGRDILVILSPPESIEVAPNQVLWMPAREQSALGKGGVTNFQATSGADLDVTLPGNHHLSGTIRC
jgi:hypothetical protein